MCTTHKISAISILNNIKDTSIVKTLIRRSDGRYKELVIKSSSKKDADRVKSLLSQIEDFRLEPDEETK